MGALVRWVGRVALAIPVLVVTAWAAAALWIDGPTSRALAGALAVVAVSTVLLVLVRQRPWWRACVMATLVFGVVLAWWLSIPAQMDRRWQPDVERLPAVTFAGDRATIRNVRNFDYRTETDFTPHWEERTYDLASIVGVDLFLSFWGPTLIAHTIMSWEFADGQHLAVSIETRKEEGETYSAVLGFFRQFELYYVVADERDVVRLRTNYRGEEVYLYRLRAPPALARAVLESYLREVDHLTREAEWYNAFTHNCTTTIRSHVQQAGVQNPLDWRLLVNGDLDALLYERGQIETSRPYPEMRQASDVTWRARAAELDPAFSSRIREGLPARPR